MTSANLQNLVRIGELVEEPARADELSGLKQSGLSRLADAERTDLSFESRFDLAYNAAHAASKALSRLALFEAVFVIPEMIRSGQEDPVSGLLLTGLVVLGFLVGWLIYKRRPGLLDVSGAR
ncbi:MAG: hypothetical protein EHM23_35350 [Acidobacteria bacterium]|nr:MAG: hypothetical protein EHM23_35350 [Acidobacteriota bacterium]